MEFLMMFAEGMASDFATNVLPIIRLILLIIITLCAITLIITTLLQSSANAAGSSALSGGATDTYFSQSKDNSRDGKLKRITIWVSSVLLVCVIAFFVTGFFINF